MSGVAKHVLRCDLGDDYSGTVHAGHVLDKPLEFSNGTATVDNEEDARAIARRHIHLHYDGPANRDGFDAEAFVDRVPMSDVIEDIKSGVVLDFRLDEIAEAEAAGRDRQGVHDAIEARQ